MALIGINVQVEVEASLASALTITAITKASPGVATSVAHGLANGDVVVFNITAGMVELASQAVRIANVAADTFELESLDTTDYSTFTTGTAQEVDSWETLGNAQSVSMPNPTPEKIDITTLLDKSKQQTFGLPEAPDGSINGLYDPALAGVQEIQAATKANEDRAFRITWAGGQINIFNALVSGGQGFELTQNAAATAPISFTPVKDVMYYAS
jgi:hypothetical protein